MKGFLSGAFVASLVSIGLYIWHDDIMLWIWSRGDHGPNCSCHREDT